MLSAKNYAVGYFVLLLRNSEIIFQHRISWKYISILFAENLFCTRNTWAFRLIQIDTFYHLPTKLREGNVFTCVCLSVHREAPLWPLPMIHWTSLYKDPLPNPSPVPLNIRHRTPGFSPLLVTSCGHHCRPIQTCSLEDTPPLVLTSGATEAHIVGWQVDGMHLTGMFSCLQHFNKIRKNEMCKKKDMESNLAWEENWDCLFYMRDLSTAIVHFMLIS